MFTLTVTVLDPAGKPAAGAVILDYMSRNQGMKPTVPEWRYRETGKTGADGTAVIPYGDMASCPAVAREVSTRAGHNS